jgi:hypothetical protein
MAYTMGYALFGALLTRWRWCRAGLLALPQAAARCSTTAFGTADARYARAGRLLDHAA